MVVVAAPLLLPPRPHDPPRSNRWAPRNLETSSHKQQCCISQAFSGITQGQIGVDRLDRSFRIKLEQVLGCVIDRAEIYNWFRFLPKVIFTRPFLYSIGKLTPPSYIHLLEWSDTTAASLLLVFFYTGFIFRISVICNLFLWNEFLICYNFCLNN